MAVDHMNYKKKALKFRCEKSGAVTFGTPVAMPGAVSLSLEPNGEPSNFYADGYAYYTISNNMGYEGDLELAMVPESFRTDVLKSPWTTTACWWKAPTWRRRTLPCFLSLTGM